MKKLILFLFVLIPLLSFAQDDVDTSQVVFPGRVNVNKTQQAPYVILISIDGFRYDYMDKFKTKHLKNFAEKGVWAEDGMYPSYPSSTFPNHYTIATGMYPAHHGLVDNYFYDPNRETFYSIGSEAVTDGSWYGGLPLWGLAETQGMRAASLFWVGSESDAGGVRPTYYYHYHEKFDGKRKAGIIKDWLQLPEEKRPHFITLYFPEVDHAGHEYGPDTEQTKEQAKYVDEAIQTLVDELKPLDLPINYVLVSDHGMKAVDEDDYIPMPDIGDDNYVVVNRGTMVRISAKAKNDIQPLYDSLQESSPKDYTVYLPEDIPEKLHYSPKEDTTRKIGDIILMPDDAKLFVDKGKGNHVPIGNHGFSPYKVPEMKATFFAWGPAFKDNQGIDSFENINIYPLITHILNLDISLDIDGDFKVLENTLAH